MTTFLLPKGHPLYVHQQRFCEVASASRSEDAGEILRLATRDHEDVMGPITEELADLFNTWSRIYANTNRQCRLMGL